MGWRNWDDRVFHQETIGAAHQPLSKIWDAPPAYIQRAFALFRLAEHAKVQWALTQVSATQMESISEGVL